MQHNTKKVVLWWFLIFYSKNVSFHINSFPWEYFKLRIFTRSTSHWIPSISTDSRNTWFSRLPWSISLKSYSSRETQLFTGLWYIKVCHTQYHATPTYQSTIIHIIMQHQHISQHYHAKKLYKSKKTCCLHKWWLVDLSNKAGQLGKNWFITGTFTTYWSPASNWRPHPNPLG